MYGQKRVFVALREGEYQIFSTILVLKFLIEAEGFVCRTRYRLAAVRLSYFVPKIQGFLPVPLAAAAVLVMPIACPAKGR